MTAVQALQTAQIRYPLPDYVTDVLTFGSVDEVFTQVWIDTERTPEEVQGNPLTAFKF